MKLIACAVILLSLWMAFTLFPKLFVMLDCFILSQVLKTTSFRNLNGTIHAPYSLGSIEYKINQLYLKDLILDEAWLRTQKLKHGGSRFEILLVGLRISSGARWEYKGKSWISSRDSGNLLIHGKVELLRVAIDLRQMHRVRRANLTLVDCDVNMGNIHVEINGKHDLLYGQLEKQAGQRLKEFIGNSCCPAIKSAVEERLNNLLRQLNRVFVGLRVHRDGFFIPQLLNWAVALAIFTTLTLIGAFGIWFVLLLVALCYINAVLVGVHVVKRYVFVVSGLKEIGRSSSCCTPGDIGKHSFVLPISKGIGAKGQDQLRVNSSLRQTVIQSFHTLQQGTRCLVTRDFVRKFK